MAQPTTAQAKLNQYLNEAYGLEERLVTSLEAHIAMAERSTYKKRLRTHLTETKRHSREVKRRIKQLGGVAETVSAPGPHVLTDAAEAAVGAGQKAIALAQGPLHALRGTGIEEKQLKNAKTEYASEAEEIATYVAIETLAGEIGDTETRKLAAAIRREEERMRSFLEREIGQLAKAVAKAEIPARERAGNKSKGKRAASASVKAKAVKAPVKATKAAKAARATKPAKSAKAKAPRRSPNAKATSARPKAPKGARAGAGSR